MACGLPVVATRVGGNPELVEDGMTGRLVPQANAEAMAAALFQYYDEPVLARRQGRAGRHLVLQRFSLDRMVADYLSLYDGLVARRKFRPEHARVLG
jgi:glycosyltransferase involved in cell wall biosynthesis